MLRNLNWGPNVTKYFFFFFFKFRIFIFIFIFFQKKMRLLRQNIFFFLFHMLTKFHTQKINKI
jgi:hypothetical protein